MEEDNDLYRSLIEALLQLNDMAEQSTQVVAEFALQKSIGLTRSKTAYIAILNENETAATLYSLPQSQTEIDSPKVAPKTYSLAVGERWAEAWVRHRRPVVANGDTPPNQLQDAPLDAGNVLRHIDVPVFDGGRIVAVAGVGIKGSPYHENDVRR